jgi:hypothetical protein
VSAVVQPWVRRPRSYKTHTRGVLVGPMAPWYHPCMNPVLVPAITTLPLVDRRPKETRAQHHARLATYGWILGGLVAGGALLLFVKKASGATVPAQLPVKSWSLLGQSVVFQPGDRYRLSIPVQPNMALTGASSIFQNEGFTSIHAYDVGATLPPDWPTDDATPGNWHFDLIYSAQQPTQAQFGSQSKIYLGLA